MTAWALPDETTSRRSLTSSLWPPRVSKPSDGCPTRWSSEPRTHGSSLGLAERAGSLARRRVAACTWYEWGTFRLGQLITKRSNAATGNREGGESIATSQPTRHPRSGGARSQSACSSLILTTRSRAGTPEDRVSAPSEPVTGSARSRSTRASAQRARRLMRQAPGEMGWDFARSSWPRSASSKCERVSLTMSVQMRKVMSGSTAYSVVSGRHRRSGRVPFLLYRR